MQCIVRTLEDHSYSGFLPIIQFAQFEKYYKTALAPKVIT